MNINKLKEVAARFNISENILRLSRHINHVNDFRLNVDDKLMLEKSDGVGWNTIASFDKGVEDVGKWDDLRFPAQAINPPGAVSDPIRDTDDGTLLFGSTGTEIVMGLALMPHGWIHGSAIHPHVHWAATSPIGGNVKWKLDYKVFGKDELIPSEWSSEEIVIDNPGLGIHTVSLFPSVDMTGFELATIMQWRLSRVGGEDTHNANAKMLEFDLHYQKDSFGSYAEFAK